MTATVAGILLAGTHAARPAASAPPVGSIYSCSDHSLIYVTNGSAWSTWASLTGTGAMATDVLWDAAGDLAVGTGANTGAKLALGASGKVPQSNGSTLVYSAPTGLLLTYDLAADITNQAITAGTFFDLFANQNFSVAVATSIIQVSVRGYGFYNDNNTSHQYLTRVNIDSGGTPILRYLAGASDTHATTNSRQNPLAGGTVFISGLTAGVHTIKVQTTCLPTGVNDHFYCRASTNGPTTGGEFLTVQVIEHL